LPISDQDGWRGCKRRRKFLLELGGILHFEFDAAKNPLHDRRAFAELSANLEAAVRPESPKLAPMASPTF
jgi:hypothetical protein